MDKKLISDAIMPPLRNDNETLPSHSEAESLRQYLQATTSESTRKTYRSSIRQFEKWGGRLPTDCNTLIRYLLAKAELLNTRTLDVHLTAISQWHQFQGLIDPATDPKVRKVIDGIRRTHGKPKIKAKALRLEHVAQMIKHLEEDVSSIKDCRDKALLLTGFFGAFRRSELIEIRYEDLIWEPEGLIIHMNRSKTDQLGEGLTRALPYADPTCCPGTAIKTWLNVSGIKDGTVFRAINRWGHIKDKTLSPGSINLILKNLGEICGFDFIPELSSHSFRRGLSTSAARERVDFQLIKKQGGWKSDTTVWEYIDEGQQFSENASLALMEKMALLLKTSE